MNPSRNAFAFLLTTLLLALAAPSVAFAEECPPGNLLQGRAPVASRGTENPERLTDGWLTLDGHAPNLPESAQLRGLRPYVTWDLGEERRLSAIALQGDNNDVYRLSASLDGKHFEPFWEAPRVDGVGLRERASQGLDVHARYLRLEPTAGDAELAVSEVRAYCQTPDPWPPSRVVRRVIPDDPTGVLHGQVNNFKIALGLAALPLLYWLWPRIRRRRLKHALVAALVVLSAATWVQLGTFHGDTRVHPYDMFHYFMGTKYFPELGYFELYRCTAAADRKLGRGKDIDGYLFRDVDDNRAYPGYWTRTHDGRCRADFSPERWREFREDVERFNEMMPPNMTLARVFGDHGYNATPIYTSWVRMLTAKATPTVASLSALAVIDWVALIGVLAVVGWGFGARAVAVTALFLAIGFPWGYHWVGGGLARHVWLLFAVLGVTLLHRDRVGWGMAALSVAVLLRLFPALFLGAAGLWLLARWWRQRRPDTMIRHGLVATAVTLAVGIGMGAAGVGASSYRDFVTVVQRHSETPLSNHMGLASLLAAREGHMTSDLLDTSLTDRFEVWSATQRRNRVERRPLQIAFLLGAFGYLIWAIRRGAPLAEATALGGPLVFCAVPLTSYDYTWMLLLLPLVIGRVRREMVFLGFVCLLLYWATTFNNMELRHIAYNYTCLGFLGWLLYSYAKELRGRGSDPAAPAEPDAKRGGDPGATAEPAPPAATSEA